MEGWGRHSRLGNGRSKGRQAGQEEAAGCMQAWVWKTQAAVTTVGLGTVPLCHTGTHILIFFESWMTLLSYFCIEQLKT